MAAWINRIAANLNEILDFQLTRCMTYSCWFAASFIAIAGIVEAVVVSKSLAVYLSCAEHGCGSN